MPQVFGFVAPSPPVAPPGMAALQVGWRSLRV